jgi:hypothetical protein
MYTIVYLPYDLVFIHNPPSQTSDTQQSVLLVGMTTFLVSFPSLSLAFTGAIGNRFAFGTFSKLLDLGFDIGAAPTPTQCIRCGTVVFNNIFTIRARQFFHITELSEPNVPFFYHIQELGFWNAPM